MTLMKLLMIGLCAVSFSSPVFAGSDSGTASGPKMDGYKKPSPAELRKKLSPEQFDVTQHEGTEAPFHNPYWDNHAEGIYVDVVSGEPLFSSLDKYDSGTGWPSFFRPLEPGNIQTKKDSSLFMSRTEVRSTHADSHLGHVFDDGPKPTGLRYCMNSASLRFIPKDKLIEEGYGKYAPLFGIKASAAGAAATAPSSTETALLAGGCFWGMQNVLRAVPGVISSRVGYTGGNVADPSYEKVSSGATGHAESIEIKYDPNKISNENLLKIYFKMHDPTSVDRQGNDVGTQYRSEIFYENEKQKETALKVKALVDKSGKWGKPVVTKIEPAKPFYPAEDYHQDYLVKHPDGYNDHYLRDFNFD